jgi:hypothetical protein
MYGLTRRKYHAWTGGTFVESPSPAPAPKSLQPGLVPSRLDVVPTSDLRDARGEPRSRKPRGVVPVYGL